jgi:hypothetical protein
VLVVQLVFAVRTTRRTAPGEPNGPLFASALSVSVPLVTLVLYVFIFVLVGASHDLLLAGESGSVPWLLWACVWWPLLIGNLVVFLVAWVALFGPSHLPGNWPSFLNRPCAVFAVGFALCSRAARVLGGSRERV